jgi:hypothetical protein
MSSPKQIAANQKNAQKSTGPKTDIGKATVSKNAIKHGLLSDETTLPWEDASDLENLRIGILSSLNPEGELESILTDRVVSLTWRLRRAGKIETAIFAWQKYSDTFNSAISQAQAYSSMSESSPTASLFSNKMNEADERRHDEAMRKASESSRKANSELSVFGRQFAEQADTFSKLNRYETSLEKSLFKSLHELQRLQAVRAGSSLAPPVAVDVYGDTE